MYISSTFVLPKQVIKVGDYARFYQQVSELPTHSQSLFVFLKPSKSTPKVDINDATTTNKIALAKHLLEQSEFAQALEVIGEVVALDETNGEAQYLLGISLGFAGNNEQSEKAFERAEQLGYQD